MEQAYLDLGRKILAEGNDKSDRTGTGTRSVFGHQMRFDLSQGFPLLTTKRVPFGLIKSELLWFLKGDTNIRYLLEHNNHIWDEWAFERYIKSEAYTGPDMTDFGRRSLVDEAFNEQYQHELKLFCEKILADDAFAETFGDLGHVYGYQWRHWEGRLSCQLYQRSADVFLGVPFNIASYALLTHLIAHETGLEVGDFVHTLGDAHLYSNHMEQMKEQLTRSVRPAPTLQLNPEKQSIFDFEMEDITLAGYDPHPTIKAPIAV